MPGRALAYDALDAPREVAGDGGQAETLHGDVEVEAILAGGGGAARARRVA
jgi:hypothetical protein